MNPRGDLEALFARIDEALGRKRPSAVELAPGNEPVPFEELKPDTLRSAMVRDIDTQVGRYREAMGQLFWSPESAKDEKLLRDAVYARTALRVSGLSTVIN